MCIRDRGNRAQPLSAGSSGVQKAYNYQSNTIITDMSKELMEEEDMEAVRQEQGLTEIKISIEGKEVKTLVDTGSEVSVISEHILDEIRENNKHIPSLPVAGVSIVGVTGVRSKRVTKQVQLNMIINGGTYENSFLVVRGLNLEVILGNDFLIRHSAVIDFKKRIVELSHESQPIRVSFERVSDAVRVSGLRVIQNRGSDKRTEVRVNACSERDNDEREEQIWEKRASKFCSEGGVIGSPQ